MRSYLPPFFRFVAACCLLMLSASLAKGQCGVNTKGFNELGIVPNNPFHAEIVTTRSGSPAIQDIRPLPHPEMVARDSQGRVRFERVTGKFKRDTGPEAGTEVNGHNIMICDTNAETLTQIDTVNATAKIIHSRPSAPSYSTATHQWAFCSGKRPSRHNPDVPAVDLGDQIIEGVQAHGWRITMKSPLGATASGDSSAGETISDIWCSDELSAVVLRVTENTRNGLKSTIAMRKIERTEPDPALFQIPPDYAVTESVTPSHENQRLNVQASDQR
jgi:hypothetical protein